MMENSDASAFVLFSAQLLDDPSVKMAIANRSVMMPLQQELYSLYIVVRSEIDGSTHGAVSVDLYSAAKQLGVSLAKAVWASQLTRRLDAGNYLDVRKLNNRELEIYLLTGQQ